MGKFSVFRQKLAVFTAVISIIISALVFSYFLGKYYLHNVVKSYPVTKTVYRKVYYSVAIKEIRLQPLSVYTLQAGVFTDMSGAEQFANSLKNSGLRPFITSQPPYKVFVFIAPTREKLEIFKSYVPEEVFVVNDILNNVEVEVRADKVLWLEFLPHFAELFSKTLTIINENSTVDDEKTAVEWLKLANDLKGATNSNSKSVELNALTHDFEALAQHLRTDRLTIQEKGSCAQILLKTKDDYDNIRQFFAKF